MSPHSSYLETFSINRICKPCRRVGRQFLRNLHFSRTRNIRDNTRPTGRARRKRNFLRRAFPEQVGTQWITGVLYIRVNLHLRLRVGQRMRAINEPQRTCLNLLFTSGAARSSINAVWGCNPQTFEQGSSETNGLNMTHMTHHDS